MWKIITVLAIVLCIIFALPAAPFLLSIQLYGYADEKRQAYTVDEFDLMTGSD